MLKTPSIPITAGALQARDQEVTATKPQLLAEPLAALIRPDDEQSHEAEAAAIGDDRSAADQLATLLGGDKPLRVRIPEYLRIVAAGIPAFVGRPLHQGVQLGPPHLANGKVRDHQIA